MYDGRLDPHVGWNRDPERGGAKERRDYWRVGRQNVKRKNGARRARRFVMREVAAMVAGVFHVRGQAEAATLRKRSYRDPALGKEGEHGRHPPSIPLQDAYAQIRSEHSF